MPIVQIFVIVLVVVLSGSSIFFASKVIFPNVLPLEETRRSEIENGRFDEGEFNQWQRTEFNIPSPFGYDLACVYFPLENTQKTIILSHGITWSRYGSIKYMPIFRKHGYNILIYDLRNHGLSGGKNTTFGLYEKFDLQILVDWAFQQLGETGMVGTHGESLGGATTLQHAAIDPRISFAIADCPFSDLTELLKYRFKADYHLPAFPILNLASLVCKVLAHMPFYAVSPIRDLPAVTTPIFWIHGQDDDYIPPDMSQRMFDAKIKGVRKIYLAPKAAHAKSQINNPAEYDQKIGEFLDELELG